MTAQFRFDFNLHSVEENDMRVAATASSHRCTKKDSAICVGQKRNAQDPLVSIRAKLEKQRSARRSWTRREYMIASAELERWAATTICLTSTL